MNQITIYELLPLLRKGYVAMDEDKEWWWFQAKPDVDTEPPACWCGSGCEVAPDFDCELYQVFVIKSIKIYAIVF